jgi:hypothetical protein
MIVIHFTGINFIGRSEPERDFGAEKSAIRRTKTTKILRTTIVLVVAE